MGSGGNEIPLGREMRMNVTRAEGAAASEALKCAQQSEPQPTTTGGSVRALHATGQSQDKDANRPAKAERKAASKTVKVETRQQDQKRKITKEQPGSEAVAAAKAPKASQTVNVGIHFVCTRGFHHNSCLFRVRKSRNRGIL